ncbi:MAG TPA: hypothetical protein VJ793_11725 [Anaerolineae bacterium]|nr:hypothetical protein [Anaerolineae bacterium]
MTLTHWPTLLQTVLRVVVFLLGASVVFAALASAIRTFVLPRSASDFVGRAVFASLRRTFDRRVRKARTYEERDRIMALYAPIGLLLLLAAWLVLVWIGFFGMLWAVGVESWHDALRASGLSLLTLGFASPDGLPQTILAFAEAMIGLILIALLIAYLPTIYAAFSRRETAVTLLEVRAGSPPSAVEMILRYNRIHGLHRLSEVWTTWEAWFADVEESHTSLAALVFFRSPKPEHSWVTAAGAVLDAASLVNAAIDAPHDPQADLCIRAGYIALRRIADFFRVSYDPQPRRGDPISISREEFDEACEVLAEAGVPLKPDRDLAWLDFAGWRVNYDTVLLALASITMAPYAPWSSDRSVRQQRPARRGRERS